MSCWRQAFCCPTPAQGSSPLCNSPGIAVLCDLERPLDLSEHRGSGRGLEDTLAGRSVPADTADLSHRLWQTRLPSGCRVQEVGTFLVGSSFSCPTSDQGCYQKSVP